MKKITLLLLVVLSTTMVVSAQSRSVGLRLGYGLEATYQHSLGQKNMLTADLGLPGFVGFGAAVTYDWIFPIKGLPGNNWNWYAGVGGGVNYVFSGQLGFGVAGRIGLEYTFDFPLMLSIDYRPIIGPETSPIHQGDVKLKFGTQSLYSFGLSVKYKF